MAEIKSTLDLVLEKTRNLKFSSEEKRALQLEEARKAFNGLLQKYLDQQLELEALQQGMTGLERKHGLDDRGALRTVVVDKLELANLDGPLLSLLGQLFGCDTEALRTLAMDYQNEMAARAGDRRRQLEAFFKERRTVWGKAVQPNLEADPMWRDESATLHELFTMKLEKEKSRLLSL